MSHTSAPGTPVPQPLRRTRSAGGHMPEVDTEIIEQKAIEAAQAGQSLIHSCPYPFGTEAGLHFRAVWHLHFKRPAN